MASSRSVKAAAVLLLGIAAAVAPASAQTTPDTGRAVVLIVTDGFRRQERLGSAGSALNTEELGGVDDTALVRRSSLVGDAAVVTNGLKFSYPGDNVMLTGRADPRIDRNDFGPNPNVTMFEWLATQPGFHGHVAAFGTWDAFAPIFNRARAQMPVHAGWELPFPGSTDPPRVLLESLYATTTRIWPGMPYDAVLKSVVMECLRTERPRELYLGFGETDEWAHSRRYDRYLATAYHVDAFIRDLWNAMQATPEYAGRTTLINSTDHGRGSELEGWTDHGKDVERAENSWIAVMGPGIPPLGERRDIPLVTQAQVAATVAAGTDWGRAARPARTAVALPVFAR